MALPARFLDDLKARVGLSDLIGRRVRLARTGKEHIGLCPFHSEKTPSFTVNDQKGFYHCFGCGAHGSALDFVMNTEGLGFREAVEQLASHVGLEVPEEDSRDQQRRAAQKSLGAVMEDVTRWYAAQLQARVGAKALAYLQQRGLHPQTIAHFRLGFAPPDRTALKDALIARGQREQDLIDTGMLVKPDDGGPPYDRFRNRIMFPITDRQGRLIAFGGRALEEAAKAKYLNSPETVLFHKGASLYNWPSARKAAYKSGELLVVEGYMDVIALYEAGIEAVVAPLGTAVSEEQIAHLWTMVEEPVLSFDGDQAGFQAARRAMERALPLLRPGRSLRFLLMAGDSGGKDDPDSFIRRQGREAFERLIDEATPFVDFLWQSLSDGVNIATPERRAGLEKQVFVTLAQIRDESVRKLYRSEFRSRLWHRFRAGRASGPAYGAGGAGYGSRGSGWRKEGYGDAPFRSPTRPTRLAQTALGQGEQPITTAMERLLVLWVVNHPAILEHHEEEWAMLPMQDALADDLRRALSSLLVIGSAGSLSREAAPLLLDRDAIHDHLRQAGYGDLLDQLLRDKHCRLERFADGGAAPKDALVAFVHIRDRLLHLTRMKTAYREAAQAFESSMTEETQARFLEAWKACKAAEEAAAIDHWEFESRGA